jgi:hypothetical protein
MSSQWRLVRKVFAQNGHPFFLQEWLWFASTKFSETGTCRSEPLHLLLHDFTDKYPVGSADVQPGPSEAPHWWRGTRLGKWPSLQSSRIVEAARVDVFVSQGTTLKFPKTRRARIVRIVREVA